ncbi:TonB-dependent siderophore receptor [Actinobacillus porcitonsillarum]|uniref:TonB-dependent siderophore receptor n=1 Tax=Actinobacillus porcitonsillarum TaxID=189834 RepID=A0A2U8FJ51_9PAST|nr:TonB-dependent siderophore receptor [Actinobacillus porcitonsillarum]AWI51031.1 TonB-dependent siderophore receptor [Actinobacillus porcitonsillarum]
MKKTFVYSTISQVVLLAIASNAMANEPTKNDVAALDEVAVVGGGSMYKMGEVPVHQAKSAIAISRDELDKQDVKKVDEIGRYQAGFANQVFGNDTNTNWFRVRGAEVSQAVNGLPTFSYGFFTPYVESFGLEAVEVTKGADSMTFGAAQSGGLINYVTKRAHRDQIGKGEFKTNFGTNNTYGFGADYTGKMTDDESLRYRVVATLNNEDGEWDKTNNKTLYLAPTIEWDISDKTRLSLLTSYQKDYGTPSNNFFPAYGTLVSANGAYIDRNSNLGDPVNDREHNKQYSIGYELSHDFGNGLRVNSSYRYAHADNFHRGSYAFTSVDATGSVARGLIYNNGKTISHATDNHLSWDFKNDWLKNTLVVGTDYRHNKIDTMYDSMGFGATTNTNIFNPQVGWNQAQSIAGATHRTIKARQLGFYLQNQSRFADKYVLGLGIRHDRAKQNEYTSTQTVKDNHTSYSASFMYEAPYGLNPYFSYSESFNLPVGLSGTQTLYDPNITRQYEVGVKYLPTWLDGVITVAGFRAKDTGALVGSNTGTGITESSDDPTYRKGIEVQADVNLTENWNATLAYTYTKSEIKVTSQNTVVNRGLTMGEKVRNQYVPTTVVSAKTAYTFNNGALNGLTIGAGVRYIGHSVTTKSQWNTYSHYRVPSATVVDLMARYAITPNWTAQVNVDNVGNRKYIAACDFYCYYGAERKVNATVSYKF